MINYRSIDTEWDNEFGSCEGIIDSRQNKSRHFMAEINRVPYLIKKKISQKEEFLANTIIYGHVKLQLPVLESEHDAAELEKFFHEFKKTRQFGEMSCDYNKKNYNIINGDLYDEFKTSGMVHSSFL